MKVLFAVNNDNISDAIVKKYQKVYREIVSYKNVYYFNAILKELQKDKTYDRIVISEDLEPFANNNYDTIDKFLFEKLDKISDEATKVNGEDIHIILICSDRRNKADDMLNKIFGIGIYNALIGDERSIDSLCKLLNQPRNKKEAKIAYKIDGNNIGYQAEDENNVSEAEVQNILAHYKRLGKNEDKYVDSFNNIVSQYTDSQLKIIIRYLPINVKAVLEERSPKYQELSRDNKRNNNEGKYVPRTSKDLKEETIKVKMLKSEKDPITKPIVIPSSLGKTKTTRLVGNSIKNLENAKHNPEVTEVIKEDIINDETEDLKVDLESIDNSDIPKETEDINIPKKGRGRPRKNPIENNIDEDKPKRGRGRPKKNIENVNDGTLEQKENIEDEDLDFDLFNMDTNNSNSGSQESNDFEETDLFNMTEKDKIDEEDKQKDLDDNFEDFDLFNMDMEEENNEKVEENNNEDEDNQEEEFDLFSISDENDNDFEITNNNYDISEDKTESNLNVEKNDYDEIDNEVDDFEIKSNRNNSYKEPENENNKLEEEVSVEPIERKHTALNSLLTGAKKIVSFVGTTKNGTSFVVNNLALMLSSMNISCAILDTTKSKNSFYIYTNNEDRLRNIAEQTIKSLKEGRAEGIDVNKYLSVYTEIPGQETKYDNIDEILSTLLEKHDIVLIDTDFNTDVEFFEDSQEIYLVQSMDVLTIQPLTAFLRNLKSKGALKEDKIRIVLNKWQKVGGLTEKVLIGGMSSYNDPSMSFMTELFDKNNAKYCKIPFEIQNNITYLEYLVNCQISLKGYTKQFIMNLNDLANVVYPLINTSKYSPLNSKKKNRMQFSDDTNNTLSKMKNNY